MSASPNSALDLSLDAVRLLCPVAGEVVRVRDGKVFVFAEGPDGRRAEVAMLVAGELMIGCAPNVDGSRMVLTGVPSTRVDVHRLDDAVEAAAIAEWITRLGKFLADGHWPVRVLDIGQVDGVLALGEQVGVSRAVGPSRSDDLEWVSLVSGSARVCGVGEATIGPLDPPFPLTRSMWLTGGSRCRPRLVSPPPQTSEWVASLDRLGAAVLTAASERRLAADRSAISRLNPRRRSSQEAARVSVDLLARAVIADVDPVQQRVDGPSAAHVAAFLVARASCGRATIDADKLVRLVGDPSMSPVDAAAAAVGARSREVLIDKSLPWRDGRPLLAWSRPDDGSPRRPVAVVRNWGWVVVDPLAGTRRRLDARSLAELESRGVEFVPMLPGGHVSLWRLIAAASRGVRRDVVWGVALTLLIGASSFAVPVLIGRLLSAGSQPTAEVSSVVLLLLALLSIAASVCFGAARAFCILRVRGHGASGAASALVDRVIRQDPTWHRRRSFGDRFGQATAVMNASSALSDDAIARLLDLAVVGGSVAALATTTSLLFSTVVATLVIEAVVVFTLLRMIRVRATARLEAGAIVVGRLQELLKGVTRLRVAGAQSRALLHWARVQVRFSRADQALRRVRVAQHFVLGIWPASVLIVIVAAADASNASIGSLMTAQLATAAASAAIAAAAFAADAAMISESALRRAVPVLGSTPEGGRHLRAPGVLQGAIGARDIVFRYHENGPAVLDRVSVHVSPGEHVAVVGPSGCGKTTLMRVMLGLEHAESGTLTFDGVDLALLDQPAVRRQIGSVLQSAELLPSSIRRNVDMGRGLSGDEIWAALDAAGVGADVREMPLGLDTPVSDGSGTLSGGQRQRVLIARALANSPRVLVLDEATSALDNVSQATVVEVLERLRITRVTVAHRLSTIRHADRILVMEAGRVVDEGTFDELIVRNGLFEAMARRQQV